MDIVKQRNDEALQHLIDQWREFKAIEKGGADGRRAVESAIIEFLNVNPESEGTTSKKTGTHKVTVNCRFDRKVDDKIMMQIADEHNVGNGILSNLFSWKPSVIKKNWDAAHEEIKQLFAPAITVKPAKAGVKIEDIKQ